MKSCLGQNYPASLKSYSSRSKVNMAMGHGRFEMNGINKAIKIGRLSKRTQPAKLTVVFIVNYIC